MHAWGGHVMILAYSAELYTVLSCTAQFRRHTLACSQVRPDAVQRVPDLTKQRFVEGTMLLCELSILAAVVVVTRFNMMAPSTTSGASGMERCALRIRQLPRS